MERFFPIRTETACRLKWSWSTLYLTEAKTASCHRASVADITIDTFDNFHNLENKIRDRTTMLEGSWPGAGCEYCRDIEFSGGYSDRQFQLTVPDVYPPELDIDPTATEVSPVVLEIFFDKTCNLGCLYCTEKYSSTIEKENQKFGYIDLLGKRGTSTHNHYKSLAPKLWLWLERNSNSLKRLGMLGGEPLIQPDFIKILDFFETHPNPQLELNFVTNLIVKPTHLANCIERIQTLVEKQAIGRVDILASVDSWGPAQEYVRWGFDRNIFESNLHQLMSQKNIRLGLLSTVNSLSIHELPQLAKKFLEWNLHREIFWYLHLVLPIGEHLLSPSVFTYDFWQSYLEKTLNLIPDATFDQRNTRHTLQGIMARLVHSQPDQSIQKKLISYLNEIDRRRNLDWRFIFPWLEKELAHVV